MPQGKDKIIIGFEKKLYDLRAIENTIKAYQGLADFNLETKKGIFEVEATAVDKDIKDVFKDEFCNYVLSETKKVKSPCL